MTTKKRIAESTELAKIKGTYAHWQERAQTALAAAAEAECALEATRDRLAHQLAAAEDRINRDIEAARARLAHEISSAEAQRIASKARVERELEAATSKSTRLAADARRRADDAERRRELAEGRWKQEVRRLIEVRARRDWGSEWFQHVREYTVGRPTETSEAASQAGGGGESSVNLAHADVEIA